MKHPLSRRTLCLGSLGSLATIMSGCGFQPVYMPTASGKTGVAAARTGDRSMLRIIPERPGQVLRQALQERFGDDSGTPSAYNLSVTFTVSGQGIAIENDSIATRLRLIGTANWKLIGSGPKADRLGGRVRASHGRRQHLRVAVFCRRSRSRGRERTYRGERGDPDRDPACYLVPPAGGKADRLTPLKLPPARIQAFLRDPGDCRVVLLFGEDAGMIHDRAEALVRAVAGSLDDPFPGFGSCRVRR